MKPSGLKDELTGLFNHTYLKERLASEFERANRYVFSLSLVILSVDSLDKVFGKKSADEQNKMLSEIAGFLSGFARRNDVVTKGENGSFVFLLPDTRKKGAKTFGRRLCEVFREHTFHLGGNPVDLTASVGLASFPEDGVKSGEALLDLSSKALEHAQKEGGDCMFAFQSIDSNVFKEVVRKEEEQSLAQLKENVSQMVLKTNQGLLKFLEAYAKSMAAKDAYPRDHVDQVQRVAEAIAREMNLPGEHLEDIKTAAMLYRLGKAGISKSILQKEKGLSESELEKIREYPKLSVDILKLVHFLGGVVPIVLSHREWFDGNGYPDGLKGEKIPIGARILAVADSFEALTAVRPYRKAYTVDEALDIVRQEAGTRFDPVVVEALVKLESFLKAKHK